MHLVKWLRKNNMKVMAVVIIVLMVGFIGGSYIQQLGQKRASGLNKTVAFFADNKKLTNYDFVMARQELAILNMLQANRLLASTQDLRTILLGELLFSDRKISISVKNFLNQLILTNNYQISEKQINDIYRRSLPAEVYWLLLKKEAQQAGVKVAKQQAGQLLTAIIPQLFPNANYPQLINSIINNRGIPEEKILEIFAKLMAVTEYTKIACSNENVTNSQIMHNTSYQEQTLDVEFIKFGSALFTDTQKQPTQQQVSEQYDNYKKFFAGDVSEQNPYGFGYKLPDRIQLEYLVVKLDDISKIITPPTQQQTEQYYQTYRDRFTEQIPSDPNDPNSPPLPRTKSYSEVAEFISNLLLQINTTSKAESILQEAKTLAEKTPPNKNTSHLSTEKQKTGNYQTIADLLGKKFNIKIYAGQTGLLSPADIYNDRYLPMLYLQEPGHNPTELAQLAFAVDKLNASELGPFDAPKPEMYQNIGPVRDGQRKIMALVRLTDAKKAAVPENINLTYNKITLALDSDSDTTEKQGEDIYLVKDEVINDLKRLAAMKTTKSKTEEFIRSVTEHGWDDAIDKFNQLHSHQLKQNDEEPNAIEIQSLNNLQRISKKNLATIAEQSRGNPIALFLSGQNKKHTLFVDSLCSLIPQNAKTVDSLPLIMEFKPGLSHYCIKNISINRLTQQQYEQAKAAQSYQQTFLESQSLAAVHFSPQNILKRTNFRFKSDQPSPIDTNTPAELEEKM